MLKRTGSVLIGLLMVAGGAAIAEDATLESMTGSVLVDTGNDFQEAGVGAKLNKGDRVMVMEGAEAVIEYENGCKETIVGSKIITIDQPCKAAAMVFAGSNAYAVAAGAGVVAAGLIIGNNNDGDNNGPVSP